MGGDPTSPSSYVERVVFMDDTTDNYTPGNDQGKVRVAKLFSGDIDNDGAGDIVFSSASFAADKPHIYMIEHSGTLGFDNEQPPTPKEISIGQNYPNPFNPETRFQYSIHQSDHASLIIYDLLGKEVQTLFDGHRSAGTHVEKWTGIDKNNHMVSSGIYFYQLRVGKERITKKMIFEK